MAMQLFPPTIQEQYQQISLLRAVSLAICLGVAELKRLIENLSFLAKTGSFAIWTRGHTDGISHSDIVRQVFRAAEFEEVDFKLTPTGDMGVGIHRYLGEGLPLPQDQQLFVFSGDPNKYKHVSISK
ncbi:MAG: hypothetical protein CLLPBCKN_006093 [Chroococcidiopsis cubana SAG 39.79]|nr:hypothetical protein [Chroococcidiopsis cubana SAG 39.79]